MPDHPNLYVFLSIILFCFTTELPNIPGTQKNLVIHDFTGIYRFLGVLQLCFHTSYLWFDKLMPFKLNLKTPINFGFYFLNSWSTRNSNFWPLKREEKWVSEIWRNSEPARTQSYFLQISLGRMYLILYVMPFAPGYQALVIFPRHSQVSA